MDELVKRLREEASEWCSNCCYRCGDNVCGAPDDRKKDCDIASKLQAADAIEELSKPKWIPVTEQLPESGQRVLVVGLHGEAMYIGTYTGGIKETAYRKAKPYKINAGGYGWRSFTWWMPLPQPPKEET